MLFYLKEIDSSLDLICKFMVFQFELLVVTLKWA